MPHQRVATGGEGLPASGQQDRPCLRLLPQLAEQAGEVVVQGLIDHIPVAGRIVDHDMQDVAVGTDVERMVGGRSDPS